METKVRRQGLFVPASLRGGCGKVFLLDLTCSEKQTGFDKLCLLFVVFPALATSNISNVASHKTRAVKEPPSYVGSALV